MEHKTGLHSRVVRVEELMHVAMRSLNFFKVGTAIPRGCWVNGSPLGGPTAGELVGDIVP